MSNLIKIKAANNKTPSVLRALVLAVLVEPIHSPYLAFFCKLNRRLIGTGQRKAGGQSPVIMIGLLLFIAFIT